MIKKIVLTLLSIICIPATFLFGQNKAKGIFVAYHYSMLPNRDDIDADERLNYETTFRYAAGLEKLNYFNNNFGIGYQLGYCSTGQDYSGLSDTNTKYTFKASTNLSYTKAALLLHYRSYNRYNPEARFKFASYFGPYVGLLTGFTDKYSVYDLSNKLVETYSFQPNGMTYSNNSSNNFDLKNPIYKMLDIGFVVAPGVQYMITPKFALALNFRVDISGANIENTGNLKMVNKNAPPDYLDYDHWNNLYAKYASYNQYNASAKKDPYDVRASTKNITMGGQLTFRWYANPQYYK